jgi:hypothetical protein
MANLVKQHIAEQKIAEEWQFQPPTHFPMHKRVVDKDLDPGRLALPGLTIEAPGFHQPHLRPRDFVTPLRILRERPLELVRTTSLNPIRYFEGIDASILSTIGTGSNGGLYPSK